MKNLTLNLVQCLILSIGLASNSNLLAHGGRTDARGGHFNHQTGSYHYHHGHPAHAHSRDGGCSLVPESPTVLSLSQEPNEKDYRSLRQGLLDLLGICLSFLSVGLAKAGSKWLFGQVWNWMAGKRRR